MKKVNLRSPYNEKYFYHDWKVKNPFLHMFGAGIVYQDDRYHYSTIRDTYLFEYIIKGKGYIECNGNRYTVSQGDTIIVKKGVKMKYGSDKKEPYTKIWFSVIGSFPDELYKCYDNKNEPELIIKHVNTYPLFEKILRHLSLEQVSVDVCSHIILDIILAIRDLNSNLNGKVENIAEQLKFFIDSFPQSNIDIETIISQYAVSKRTAVRLFRERYGITPIKYLKEAKLEKGCELLKNSTLTVSEISEILGFCDQSYFSTEFMKKYRVYPSVYRKEILRNT